MNGSGQSPEYKLVQSLTAIDPFSLLKSPSHAIAIDSPVAVSMLASVRIPVMEQEGMRVGRG